MNVLETVARGRVSRHMQERAVKLLREARVKSDGPAVWLIESDSGHIYTVVMAPGYRGSCNCRAGRENTLCCHLLAVAAEVHGPLVSRD